MRAGAFALAVAFLVANRAREYYASLKSKEEMAAELAENRRAMQAALDVATSIGIVTVSNTEFLGDEWEIEGRDYRGRWMQVDVDARTGEVRNVDRSW